MRLGILLPEVKMKKLKKMKSGAGVLLTAAGLLLIIGIYDLTEFLKRKYGKKI
jgi:hypothetical protein